jgi:E3 ubiquitin-protein ligase MARCH5
LGSEGESYQSVDFEDAESGEESDELPDLLPETFQIEQKECWICFLPESDSPGARWVSPCRCAGSLGHVHQDCVKRWVEEKQNGNFNVDVVCPQCETKYRFVFPDKNNLLRILNFSDMLIKNGVQLLVIGAVLGSAYIGIDNFR